MKLRSAMLAATLGGMLALAALQVALGASRTTAYSWFDPLIDVHTLVDTRFVREPDDEAMLEAAINALLESLGDPYSEYIPASSVSEFDKQTRGEFVGIGAEVRVEDGWLTIVSPLEDSPAYHAGVMAGDRVVSVDGESTQGLDVNQSIALLAGQPGTPVTLSIERAGETFPLTITRARIQTPTVKGVRRVDDRWDFWLDEDRRIAYVRLSQFTAAASDDLETALRSLTGAEMRGLILDLRYNPGGLLPAAVRIADLFLSEGEIVSTRGRAHEEESFSATSPGTLPDFDMVVLINRQSASASEIVAGALQERGRAVTLGERTFGKGSVQSVITLPSGAGQLKLTEQHYYLPSGRLLHRMDDSLVWGVDPSPGFFVPMTDEEQREMIRLRREEEIIRPRENTVAATDSADPDALLERTQDTQLVAALRALQGRLDTGDWAAPGADGPADPAIAEIVRMQEIRSRMARDLARLDERIGALSAGHEAPEPPDLLPDDAPLAGGAVRIFDVNGREVGDLRITGEGLERWLQGAPVEPSAKP